MALDPTPDGVRQDVSIFARFLDLFIRNLFGKMKHHIAHAVLGLGAMAYNLSRFGISGTVWLEHSWEVVAPLIWSVCIAATWHSIASSRELITHIRTEASAGPIETESSILDPYHRAFRTRVESPKEPRLFTLKIWCAASLVTFISLACSFLAYLESSAESSKLSTEVPVVHIEPEHKIVWSTGPGQTIGVYIVHIRNTGVAVDVVEIEKKYFLAQRSTGVIMKRLPNIKDSSGGLLEHGKGLAVSIDFNPYMEDIKEVKINFREGPSLPGVYVIAKYRRHSDGRNFQIARAYGLFAVDWADGELRGPALFTEGTNMDNAATGPMAPTYLTLHEVVPYLDLPERWISITKEISVGADGKVHTRQY